MKSSNESSTINDVKDHLAIAEGEDMFRYAVFAPTADDAESQDDLIAFAKTVGDDRIFIPSSVFLDNNGDEVSPQVTAAGLASVIMTETDDPALPMNGVTIRGFSGISRVLLCSDRSMPRNRSR